MSPEYQLPDTFPCDDSAEQVQLQGVGEQETSAEGILSIPAMPSTATATPVPVSSRRPSAKLIAGVIFLIAVLAGSSLFFFAKSGRSVLPANRHATVAPGVGVPVVKGDWQITLSKVHQESSLQGMETFGTDSGIYTPDSGYTFLILDIQLRDLHANQGVTISPDIFALISQDGTTSSPALVSNAAIQGYSAGVVSMYSSSNEMQLSLAFAIPQSSIGQTFKLDFQGAPLLSFIGK